MHTMRQEIIDARRRIQQAMDMTGLNASSLAREAGFAESTLTRLMGASPQSAPTYRTLLMVSQAVERLTGKKMPDAEVVRSGSMAHPKESHLDGTYGLVQIPEYDIEVSAGAGMSVPDLQNPSKVWVVPRAALENAQVSSLDNLAILTIRGDSMVPKYAPGDRVLVDRGDNVVRHDGSYVLWNQFGLIVKMVQVLPAVSESGPVFRIISKNKDYPPYECPAKDAQIHGRVVGRWVWE